MVYMQPGFKAWATRLVHPGPSDGNGVTVSESVSLWELVVWAGMCGAIVLLCLVSAVDMYVQKSVESIRSFAFVGAAGAAAVVLSGVPQILVPEMVPQALLVLKASLGPLAVALALNYLIVWLGVGRDDPLTRRTLTIGSSIYGVATLGLAYLASASGSAWAPHQVMVISMALLLCAVVVIAFVSARALLLGDTFAGWIVVLAACMAIMVGGLYGKAMALPYFGPLAWIGTALISVIFFLLLVVLTSSRNREVQRIKQLSQGLVAQSFDIPLPQGSDLIPKVADAMWRSHRLERDCVVAAIVVRNLYELGDGLGRGVETQILAVLAARIRRHVGFRNVVGLYHPRCFLLVVSPGQDPKRGKLLEESLLRSIRERVRVGPPDRRFDFWPEVGMGVVEVKRHAAMEALPTIDRAELLALADQDTEDLLSRPLDLNPGL